MAVQTFSLRSTVTDASGTPIVGATVTVTPIPAFTAARSDNDGNIVETAGVVSAATVTTNAQGQFTLPIYANRVDRPRDYYRIEIVRSNGQTILRRNFRMPQYPASLYAQTPDTASAAVLKPDDTPGLTQIEVDQRIEAKVDDWALTGDDTAIPTSKLTLAPNPLSADDRETLRDAVVADSDHISFNEREMRFVSADENKIFAVELPGITVEAANTVLGDTSSVETLNFLGAGVNATRPLGTNKVNISISGGSGGATGLTRSEVEALIAAEVADFAEVDKSVQIPINKIDISGTADGTKFLKDDGSWSTVPAGTSGLDQAAVDLRISTLAYLQNTFRDEVFGAFESDEWEHMTTAGIAPQLFTTQSPSGVTALVYANTWTATSGLAGTYVVVRIPISQKANVGSFRINIGGTTFVDGGDWVHLEDVSTEAYYVSTAINPTMGDVIQVDMFDKFELDADRVAPFAASLLVNAPRGTSGLDQAAVDLRIDDKVEDWARDDSTLIPVAKLTNSPNQLPTTGRTAGDFLKLSATNAPEWQTIADTDVAGLPTSADKTAGTAGQVLALNTAKTGYEFVTLPSTATPTPTATTSRTGTVELATQAEMDTGAVDKVPTAKEVRGYVEGRLHNIDEAADFTGLTATEDRNLDLIEIAASTSRTFTVAGTTFTLGRVYYDTQDNQIAVNISPDSERAKLAHYDVEINGNKFEFARSVFDVQGVQVDPTDLNSPYYHEWEWSAATSPLTVDSNNEIKIISPVAISNFLPTGGTEGQYVTPNSLGERVWLDLPDPTQEQVYTQDKDILVAGTGVHLTPDDANDQIRISATVGNAPVTSGNTFPIAPTTGQHFELLTNQTTARPAIVVPVQSASTFGFGTTTSFRSAFGTIDLPAPGIGGVLWYNTDARNNALFQGRLAVIIGGSNTNVPTSVVIGGTTHTVTQTSSTITHIYRSAVITNPFTVGTATSLQINYGTTKVFPDKLYTAPHIYAWDGYVWQKATELSNTDLRDRLLNLPRPWLPASAVEGIAAARFALEVEHGAVTGVGIASTNTSVKTALTGFTNAIDLDDLPSDSTQGEFDVDITLGLHNRSVTTLGFGTDNVTSWRFDGIVFANTIRSQAVYVPGDATISAVQIGNSVDLYNGATKLGSVAVYLGRNASNQVGYIIAYTGAGTAAARADIAANMEIYYSPTDSTVVADNRLIPSGGTDGQILTKTSDTVDYAVAWEDAPSGGGGGTGDITAVTTAADSGLEGGETTGAVALRIKDLGVTTARINNDAVTTAKIADDAVTVDEMANNSVGNDQLADDSVDSDKLANNAVTTAAIDDGAVTNAKIASNAVQSSQIASNAVTTAKINNDAVTVDKIADDAVGSDQLAADAVTTAAIDDGAVTDAKIASVAASKVSGTLTAANIPDLSATKITSDRLNVDRLGSNSSSGTRDGLLTREGIWRDNMQLVDYVRNATDNYHTESNIPGNTTRTWIGLSGLYRGFGLLYYGQTSNVNIYVRWQFTWSVNTLTGTPQFRLVLRGSDNTQLGASDWTDADSATSNMVERGEFVVSERFANLRALNVHVEVRHTGTGTVTAIQHDCEATIFPRREIEDWAEPNDTSLIPRAKLGTGATNSNFLRGDGTWQTVTGGGGGLDEAAVKAEIKTWAQADNPATRVPTAQMGSGTPSTTTFLRGDGSWQTLPTPVRIVTDTPDADVTLTATTAGTWLTTDTTLVTLPAITAAQAGVVHIIASVDGALTYPTSSTSGGDRIYLRARIVCRRGSTDTTVAENFFYLRNGGNFGTAAMVAVTRQVKQQLISNHVSQAGDVYRFDINMIAQQVSTGQGVPQSASPNRIVTINDSSSLEILSW